MHTRGALDVHQMCKKKKAVCKRSSICALVVQRTGIRVALDVNALNGHHNSSAPEALGMNSGDTLQDQLMYTAENSVPSLKDPRCTPKAHQLAPLYLISKELCQYLKISNKYFCLGEATLAHVSQLFLAFT